MCRLRRRTPYPYNAVPRCQPHTLRTLVCGNTGVPYPDPFELPSYTLTPLPGLLTVDHCLGARQQLRGAAGVPGTLTLRKQVGPLLPLAPWGATLVPCGPPPTPGTSVAPKGPVTPPPPPWGAPPP